MRYGRKLLAALVAVGICLLAVQAKPAAATPVGTQLISQSAIKPSLTSTQVRPGLVGWSTDAYEIELVALTNTLRQQSGLSFLPTSPALRQVARSWAIEIGNAGEINHNPNLAKQIVSSWTKVGENVGYGPSIPAIHQALIQSPAHYKNLVDPGWTAMAVGAVRMGRSIYIVELFETVPQKASAAKSRPVAIGRTQKATTPARR